MRHVLLAAILAVATPLALSATPTPNEDVPSPDAQAAPANLNRPLPSLKGVVSWKTLGQVQEVTLNKRLVPKFSTEITSLDATEVKLQGFMMPLEAGKKHKRFLLSANVPSCPFCMPGGPDSLVEVVCKEPIAFSMDPIVIYGKFSVLKDDPTGLWYRVRDAALVGGSR